MGENTYVSEQRVDPINQDKYRALVDELIPLEPNDWPKFQGHREKLYSTELQVQKGRKEVTKKYNMIV